MYKRYYDGYKQMPYNTPSSDLGTDNDELVTIDDAKIIETTERSDASEAILNSHTHGRCSESFLGNLQLDDIILIGLVILLLADSENLDTTLLIIIAVIFFSGL